MARTQRFFAAIARLRSRPAWQRLTASGRQAATLLVRPMLTVRFLSDYGSVLVLLLLCAYYSVVTWSMQHPEGPSAGRDVARTIFEEHGKAARVLIVVRDTVGDGAFAAGIAEELQSAGATVVGTIASSSPGDAREALERIAAEKSAIHAIATHNAGSGWGFLRPGGLAQLAAQSPALQGTRVYKPDSYMWPSFLTRQNLLNVIKNNAEIAIIAIGMTMVIITAGIDLSVGSVLALCGVVTAMAIQSLAGGVDATVAGLLGCCLLAAAVGALAGAFNGVMVTFFSVPAFIVTLAMMMIARGLSLKMAVSYQSAITGGATEGTPEAVRIHAAAFEWLGNGQMLSIPNPIWLMVLLYAAAHVVMTRTSIGRYIYAVGGNREAARLSGVPVYGILILVYAICGLMAALGGIVDASRFEGGRPSAGGLYELRVIAAVVVGGTSLAGGEGRILGTLIGALIIAVIQNGLNMAGVKPYEQMIVFGALILAAVLLDQLKKYTGGSTT